METLSYKTKSVNKESADKKWVIVDAEGQVLGRVASKIAYVLRGKHKATFTPHADTGDNVIVINASKIDLTGKKWDDKSYIRYTGYPGGQRDLTARELFEKDPVKLMEKAVKGMLPKTRLGREVFRNLYVYEGSDHAHSGQKPEKLDINTIK
ncbi:50S ribosomal protein L13 [Salibacter sp.]|uniref:50S ribosomal protein L13 n=1 Tax=Salibacter sp. TaxID=2010995 RepID=UPI00286FE2D0|nr:50S ribosomal protein L13 [Salibacter sp.]MDR9399009.1 50S ribosomal protein L13 [Salibacter sp.]MDR9488195.1 50S ribosomal protein L13 [Salibacter sp.]